VPVLIPFDTPWKKLADILSHTDGIFLGGGDAVTIDCLECSEENRKISNYQRRISRVINWAKKRNNKGIFYPILGVGSGML